MLFFKTTTKSKGVENKQILNKELFNSSSKKSAITRAAKQSAEDQRQLLREYHKTFESKTPSIAA